MKTLSITAYKRVNLGKKATQQLRQQGKVPCVLYGGSNHLHLYMDMALLQDMLYTPNVFFIDLAIDGTIYKCIIKEQQFHPVSDMPLHLDFLQIFDDKKIEMHIPIRPVGNSLGVTKGGALLEKRRKLRVIALPKDMPSYIEVDVTKLDLGKTARIKDITEKNYTIQENPALPVITIGIPRSLKSKESEKAKVINTK